MKQPSAKPNPFNWDCDRDGCFNDKKRLQLDVFGECFPDNIQMGDVDGIVEINGRFLMLEWKSNARLSTGQRIMFERITRFSPADVVVVVGDAATMQPVQYRHFWEGRCSEWFFGSLEAVKYLFKKWARFALGDGSLTRRHAMEITPMNGLNPQQFRSLIIRPTLRRLDMWSEAAEELLLGTAIQESALHYLQQMGGGPAMGFWQMERATHDDLWLNFLNGRTKLGLNVLGPYTKPEATRMVWDLSYACAMCRIHYLRCPDALPPAGDIAGQAAYWKRWYNTPLGKGTVEQYLESWRVAMGDTP
ncbi:hypothetical protein [Candidatus Magnetaquicoccus inordinatus]|uniref:hypothetical protein n=1 Tax=Candidatus Magnetaquicoccus inordinatus TaxID=2496818 RepID=UPI001D0E1750|nr:hypothetical protein [Candidatus Magnetaquicoccus inordinatus]